MLKASRTQGSLNSIRDQEIYDLALFCSLYVALASILREVLNLALARFTSLYSLSTSILREVLILDLMRLFIYFSGSCSIFFLAVTAFFCFSVLSVTFSLLFDIVPFPYVLDNIFEHFLSHLLHAFHSNFYEQSIFSDILMAWERLTVTSV